MDRVIIIFYFIFQNDYMIIDVDFIFDEDEWFDENKRWEMNVKMFNDYWLLFGYCLLSFFPLNYCFKEITIS